MKNYEHFFIKILLFDGQNQEAKKVLLVKTSQLSTFANGTKTEQLFRKKKRLSEQLCKNIDQTTLKTSRNKKILRPQFRSLKEQSC